MILPSVFLGLLPVTTLLLTTGPQAVNGQDVDWGDPFVAVVQDAADVGIEATADSLTIPEFKLGVYELPLFIGTFNVETGNNNQ